MEKSGQLVLIWSKDNKRISHMFTEAQIDAYQYLGDHLVTTVENLRRQLENHAEQPSSNSNQ